MKAIILILSIFYFIGCSSQKEIIIDTSNSHIDTVRITDTTVIYYPGEGYGFSYGGIMTNPATKDTTKIEYRPKEKKVIVYRTGETVQFLKELKIRLTLVSAMLDTISSNQAELNSKIKAKLSYPFLSKVGLITIGITIGFVLSLLLFLLMSYRDFRF